MLEALMRPKKEPGRLAGRAGLIVNAISSRILPGLARAGNCSPTRTPLALPFRGFQAT